MNLVPPFGPRNAKIAIVGEAPGQSEVQQGRPFVGSSGSLLRTMLTDAGIDPTSCYYTNLMQVRPYRNNFVEFYYDGKKRTRPKPELLQGIGRVKKELAALKPNIIVLLGNEPLHALTGRRGIKKWRGSLHDTTSGKALGTYHPAAILRSYNDRPIMQIDLNRVAIEAQSAALVRPDTRCIVAPTLTQVLTYLAEHQDCRICTFDTETLGRFIRCLGIATGPDEAFCIPFIRVNHVQIQGKKILMAPQSDSPSYWSPNDERKIIKSLALFFSSTRTKFVAQNFAFDVPLMEWNWGLRVKNFYFDTMHAQHLAYPEFPMNLDFLTSVYTHLGYYADYDSKDDRSTWRYNCLDCIATFQCIEPIIAELDALGMKDLYFNHIHPLIKTMTRVQERGVLIDVENRTRIAEPLKIELDEIKAQFERTYGMTLKKLISPKQVKEVLKKNNIRIPTRNRKETTDERALKSLVTRYPDFTFPQEVLDFREKRKFYGTYAISKLDEDGRMRTSYNVSGTKTGRLSSSKTLWDTGGNLQNIPRSSFRRLFIASPGRVILHADLSQAETRLVIWFSRHKELIERFLNDPTFDIHRHKATQLYGVTPSQVSEVQRDRAKACNHSGNYKISWRKFSYISHIPPAIARPLLDAHQSEPHLVWWWESVKRRLQLDRTLITPKPFERVRIFYGRLDEETFRQAYNHLAQSTVGDVINQACYAIDGVLNPERGEIIMQVHDEIDFELDEDYVEEIAPIIKRTMEVELIVYDDLPPLIIPVELSVGPNWYDQKEL